MSEAQFDLPAGLRAQFAALEKRLRWLETVWACVVAGGGLLGSFGLFFVADRLIEVPVWLRWAFFLVTASCLVATAWWWARRWWWRRPSWEDLAKVVQRRHRRLGDRLLGIVELAHQKQAEGEVVSPALCRAAIAQVAEEAEGLSFLEAVDFQSVKRWGMALAALGILTVGAAALAPQAWTNALARWAWPGSGAERFTFVEILGLPRQLIIPMGEPHELRAELRYRSFWRPAKLEGRLPGHDPLEGKIEGASFRLHIPPLTAPAMLRLAHGDRRENIELVPTHRPAVTGVEAVIEWPEYLGKETGRVAVDNGILRLIEGGRAGLIGSMTRDLVWARMEPDVGVGLELRGNGWEVPLTEAWLDGEALQVQWKDVLGLTGRQPLKIQVRRYSDEPPRPELRNLPPAVAILPDEVLEFDAVTEDDFGVERVEARYSLFDRSAGNEPMGGEELWESHEGGNEVRKVETGLRFSPHVLGIRPGTTVLLRTRARDYKPGRAWAYSHFYQILVLTPAEHASLIQEKLEKLSAGLEALAQEQENLLARTEEVAQRDGHEMASAQTSEELASQAREQEKLRQQAEQLSREAMKALEEAMRNSEMSSDQLAALAQMSERLQDVASNSMAQAQQQLSEAAQQTAGRPEASQEAAAQEKAALQRLREIQQDAGKQADQAQARNFAARLRELSELQREVGDNLKRTLPEIVGLLADEVPPPQRSILQNLAGRERSASLESLRLQKEMRAFAARLQAPSYNEVVREMEEAGLSPGLAQLGDLVEENRSGKAIGQVGHWGKVLEDWAERLSAQANQGGGGGGGGGGVGGGGSSSEMMELMIELARLRQRQASAQKETQVADEGIKQPWQRQERAKALRERQEEMRGTMQELAQRLPAQVAPLAAVIQEAMADASESLGQADLSEKTTGAQATAVEVLTQMLMDPSMGAGGAAAMMLGMMSGTGAGGNTPGGDSPGGYAGQQESDLAGQKSGGQAGGISTEFRGGDRAAGGSPTEWPPEYRDALEGFFLRTAKEIGP